MERCHECVRRDITTVAARAPAARVNLARCLTRGYIAVWFHVLHVFAALAHVELLPRAGCCIRDHPDRLPVANET